jgi:tetratricopeptide (TPR) repeat protein
MTTQASPATAGALAAEAAGLADTDPARAAALAGRALDLARRARDPAATAEAHRALGLAARSGHDIGTAVASLRRAVRVAERAGLPAEAGRAYLALAGALALKGDLTGALRAADAAAPGLRGHDLALLEGQRAFLLQMQGRLAEARDAYGEVLARFRRLGDQAREATVLHNRALVLLHLGALGAARADLVTAERLYTGLGQERAAADARENLGSVLVRLGELPAALAAFDQADAWFRARGEVDPVGLRDRCEALLAARLVAEARSAAEQAAAGLAGRGVGLFLAEARLLISEAALLQGDVDAARAAAELARRSFARQRRPRFAALARYALLRVAWAGGDRSPALLAEARRTAAACEATGWAAPALDARLIAASVAVSLGRVAAARRELAGAVRARRRGPVELRARAWHAEALLRLAAGDRGGTEKALQTGMRVLDRYRAALGATELRASASSYAADLARLGLGLALGDRDAGRVLAWAERWRASALALRPSRPPDDAALAADLAALRRVAAELGAAELDGRDTVRLATRQAALEDAVRRRARAAGPGAGLLASAATAPPTARALRAALGDRALVELVEHDGRLHAVVVTAGRRPVLRPLGRMAEVLGELEALRFALRRLATGHGSAASLAVAADNAAAAGADLDELLLGPIRAELGDRPLVIVPTGALHALPWAALPSCLGRPVSVAPSAGLWLRAATAPPPGGGVVLVAGPGLPEAEAEVAGLHAGYPDATRLDPDSATAEAALAALDGAGLAHVAAHGRFRADNPLFSSLVMADGPLTVYDLERLERAPGVLILSACDAGLSEVRPGDELMGLAAALLALEAHALIASVAPVGDAATRRLMVALHRALRDGLGPAAALARAAAERAAAGEPGAAAGFVCFGAG